MAEEDRALLELLARLRAGGYRFVAPTPATHARVLARDPGIARTIRDVLGWSMSFDPTDLEPDILGLLERAVVLERAGPGLWRSTIRVASLGDNLFLHSAYPTDARDSVFFGPDSYRFAALIDAELRRAPMVSGATIVDIGTGSGVGAIVAGALCLGARLIVTDVNPHALRLARINAAAAELAVEALEASDLSGVEGSVDLALANPPYIADDAGDRSYRDGGGMLGGQVSLAMARMAAERLAPGGRLILYTGSAIVDGCDRLGEALHLLAGEMGADMAYRELDPDVFGEELDRPAYADVDRIAVVAAIFTMAAAPRPGRTRESPADRA